MRWYELLIGGSEDALESLLAGFAEQLIRELSSKAEIMHREGRSPVLLCGTEVRRAIRELEGKFT